MEKQRSMSPKTYLFFSQLGMLSKCKKHVFELLEVDLGVDGRTHLLGAYVRVCPETWPSVCAAREQTQPVRNDPVPKRLLTKFFEQTNRLKQHYRRRIIIISI